MDTNLAVSLALDFSDDAKRSMPWPVVSSSIHEMLNHDLPIFSRISYLSASADVAAAMLTMAKKYYAAPK